MPYNITLSNGATLLTLVDGNIDSTATSLNLVGRASTNYGTSFADNFVRLLENFANISAPRAPLMGQIWYDTNSDQLRCYDGAQWNFIQTSSATNGYGMLAGVGAPVASYGSPGDLYVDVVGGIIYGPKGSTTGWVSSGEAFAVTPEGAGTSTGVMYTGEGAPSNTLGLDGSWYFDRASSILYGPKGTPTAGTWSPRAGLAQLLSPAFIGSPTAPTAAVGTNTTQIATTAFVSSSFAKIDSPIFIGTPAAPTPLAGDSSTAIATTAFVNGNYVQLQHVIGARGIAVSVSGSTVTITSNLGTGVRPVLT